MTAEPLFPDEGYVLSPRELGAWLDLMPRLIGRAVDADDEAEDDEGAQGESPTALPHQLDPQGRPWWQSL